MAQNIDVRLVVKDDGSVVVKKFGDESSKSLKKAAKSTDSFAKSMKTLTKVAGALVAIKLGKELVGVVNEVTRLGDEVAKTARQVGISTDALQSMQYVAERSGVSVGVMNKSLEIMQRNLIDASMGVGEAKDALKILNIDVRNLISLRPEEQFKLIADRVNQLGDNALKTNVAMRIFGRGGGALKRIFAEGADGIDKLTRRFDDLGGKLSTDFLASSEQYKDAILDISLAWRGLVVYLAQTIIPLINDNLDEIVSGIQWVGRIMDDTFNVTLRAKIDDVNEEIETLRNHIENLKKTGGADLGDMILGDVEDSSEEVKQLTAQLDALIKKREALQAQEREQQLNKIKKAKGAEPGTMKPMGLTDAEKKAEEQRRKEKAEFEQKIIEDKALAEAAGFERSRQAQIDHDIAMQAFRENQAEQEKKLAEQKAANEKMVAEERKAAGMQALSDASYFFQEMGKKNKTFFRLYQATAIAETIISTYKGAQEAFTALAGIPYVGPALGVAAAAAAIAAGLARVSAIASQKPEGAAFGKVVNKPTVLEVGEGAKSEAVVPLDNGQKIPVSFRNGGGMGGNTNINIYANDAKSFSDMLKKNPKPIIDAFMRAQQKGYRPLLNTQRRVL